STRATNPYAITAVSHGWSRAIVRTLIRTTPPATRRADTSLTGSGKENSRAAPSTRLKIQAAGRRRGAPRGDAAAGPIGLLDDQGPLHAEARVLDALAVGHEAGEHPDALRQGELALVDRAGRHLVGEVADPRDLLPHLVVLALAQQLLHGLRLLEVLHLEGDGHVHLLAGVDRAHDLAALELRRTGELELLHPDRRARLGERQRRRVLRHLHRGVAVLARAGVQIEHDVLGRLEDRLDLLHLARVDCGHGLEGTELFEVRAVGLDGGLELLRRDAVLQADLA